MFDLSKFRARHAPKRAAVAATALAALLAFPLTGAGAPPIAIPTGLNPGDTYRLAFVTSSARDATSSDIADYNNFVSADANSQAALAALGTTWTAITSTETVDARDNTNTAPSSVAGGSVGVPIFLMNDTRLADSYDDLWDGTIDNPLDVTASGGTLFGGAFVWTRTSASGEGISSVSISGPGSHSFVGRPFQTDAGWMFNLPCCVALTSNALYYGISGLLTVPSESTAISGPGASGLLALGLAGLGYARRSRKA